MNEYRVYYNYHNSFGYEDIESYDPLEALDIFNLRHPSLSYEIAGIAEKQFVSLDLSDFFGMY